MVACWQRGERRARGILFWPKTAREPTKIDETKAIRSEIARGIRFDRSQALEMDKMSLFFNFYWIRNGFAGPPVLGSHFDVFGRRFGEIERFWWHFNVFGRHFCEIKAFWSHFESLFGGSFGCILLHMTCKEPSKSPGLPKRRNKTSRCGGVAPCVLNYTSVTLTRSWLITLS